MSGLAPVFLRGRLLASVRAAAIIGLVLVTLAVINRPHTGLQADSVEPPDDRGRTPAFAALATYPVLSQETEEAENDGKTAVADAAAESFLAPLPTGYIPEWEHLTTGEGITLQILKNPFRLDQTHRKLGGEHFSYTAWLFRQAAMQVEEADWRNELNGLAADADELGFSVRESGRLWFEGTPTGNMNHLRVRSQIMAHLNELNSGAVHLIDEDETGKRQDHGLGPEGRRPGASLSHFMERLSALEANGFFATIPGSGDPAADPRGDPADPGPRPRIALGEPVLLPGR